MGAYRCATLQDVFYRERQQYGRSERATLRYGIRKTLDVRILEFSESHVITAQELKRSSTPEDKYTFLCVSTSDTRVPSLRGNLNKKKHFV